MYYNSWILYCQSFFSPKNAAYLFQCCIQASSLQVFSKWSLLLYYTEVKYKQIATLQILKIGHVRSLIVLIIFTVFPNLMIGGELNIYQDRQELFVNSYKTFFMLLWLS